MPPKTYLFISLLCHVALVVLWWFGPSLPTIELTGMSPPDQTRSQKQTVHVRLKKEGDVSADRAGNPVPKQPESVPAAKFDGQTAFAESQQHGSLAANALADQPDHALPSRLPPTVVSNGHLQEEANVSSEPPPTIRYTASPQTAKASDQTPVKDQQDEMGREKRGGPALAASPSGISERRATTEVLPAADGLRRDDGLQAPAFNVYLPPDDIDLILMARQGIVLVLCEQEQYLVEGTLRNPARVLPATSQLLQTFSERALQVPSGYCQHVADRLQGTFAISEDRIRRCRFHLLLNNQVDYLVLNRQRAAASRLRYPLEELVATFGRFEFTDRQVVDYQIQSVALKDGRRLPLASASALPGHVESR
jgi:hypothetical protein